MHQGDFCKGVTGLDEGREKFDGEVVALLESAAIEDQNGGFAVDGGLGAGKFLEVRQGSADTQHGHLAVTIHRAGIVLLNDHGEPHFVLGAEPGERSGRIAKVWFNRPFRGQGERELGRAVHILRASQDFVDFGKGLFDRGRVGSLGGTIFREGDGHDVAAVQLHLAVGGFYFDFVGGDAGHVADDFRAVLQDNFFRQRGQSSGQKEQADGEWPKHEALLRGVGPRSVDRSLRTPPWHTPVHECQFRVSNRWRR